MRCEVERTGFAEMLVGVVNALPSKSAYPVLHNLIIEVSGGRLAVSGTDLDTYVRRTMVLEGPSEDGRVMVPGRKLAEIVRETAAPTLTFTSKDLMLNMKAGSTRAVFNGLDPAEFPDVPSLPEGVTMEFPLADLLELFDATAFAASHDEGRPAMTGVNWEVNKTETRMVATDGHRLAMVTRRGKHSGKVKVIIATKVFSLFPRGEEKVIVHLDPSKVGFVFQNTTIITRVIEGPYPDYERVIPKDYPARAIVDHEVLSASLRRATVFAHPIGRLVAFRFNKDGLRLEAEAPDLGHSEEEVECEYQGEEIRIGFNVGLVLEILRHMLTDKVVIELSNPLAAGLFKPA
ncbi:MAG: DNA polymerase III subunit beta, partial [candidate division WOR-3 bacterium]